MADNVHEGAVEFGTPEWEARFGAGDDDNQDVEYGDAQDTNTPGEVPQMIKDMQSKPKRASKGKAKATTNMAEAKANAKAAKDKEKADAKAAAAAERQAAKEAKAKEKTEGPSVDDIVSKKPAVKSTLQNVPLDLLDGIDGGDPVGRDFVENVRLHGVIEPIVVRPLDGGRFNIIAGKRRSQAARALELPTIPAVVVKDATSNDFTIALSENNARSHNIIEEHRMVKQLIEDERAKGDTGANDRRAIAKIAKATGMTSQQVKAARDVGRLVPELMTAAEDGALSSWSALQASRMPVEAQNRLVEILNENGKVTTEDVNKARRARQTAAVGDTQDAADESGQSLYDNPEDLDGDDENASGDAEASRSTKANRARTSITEAIRNLEGMGAKSDAERDALVFLSQALDLLNA